MATPPPGIGVPYAGEKDPPAGRPGEKGDVLEETRTDKPKMYKCLLHNDDYTTMEFVVEVLISVFRRTKVEATRIMLLVHQNGIGVAGIYTKEVAEARVQKASGLARDRGYPLLVTSEPE